MSRPLARLGCGIATALALLWGVTIGRGRVSRHRDLIVVSGLPRGFFGRGGTTVGRVYLTADAVSPAVLRHELVHVRQWRRHGLALPLLYLRAGRDPLGNRFEIEAGLEDGGYRTAPTAPRP